jgi:phenylacetate-coenzyme A ligase PaaK-like adenylate-forming protein
VKVPSNSSKILLNSEGKTPAYQCHLINSETLKIKLVIKRSVKKRKSLRRKKNRGANRLSNTGTTDGQSIYPSTLALALVEA